MTIDKSSPLSVIRVRFFRYAGLYLLFMILASASASAQSYPAPWPSDASWITYPRLSVAIQDLSTAGSDKTDGGTGVNPDSSDTFNGTAGNLPTVYFYYDATNQVIFFRMRLRGDPRASGGGGGAFSNGTWNALLDIDGDGYKEFFVETNGNGSPDNINLYYADTNQQDLPSGVTCAANGQWPVWNQAITLGTHARVTDNTATGGGYFMDFQVPLSAFKNCSNAQVLTPSTPFSLVFTTSQTTQNPTQKDMVGPGDYAMATTKFLPGGDILTLSGGISQIPFVTGVSRTCGAGVNSSPITLTATSLDTLDLSAGAVVDTINRVVFSYSTSVTGPWTQIAQVVTPNANTVNAWSTQWNTSSLAAGTYYIKVEVIDDQSNKGTNSTFNVALPSCTAGGFTTPVSLAYFKAGHSDQQTLFEWSTATEVGNVGFNLYVQKKSGLRKINTKLIRSRTVDSTSPQDYSYKSKLMRGGAFFIEDVDITGQSKLHGPFKPNKSYGARVESEPINWIAIQAEHEAKERLRDELLEQTNVAEARTAIDLNLTVDRDGLYRVTYEDILRAGVDLNGVPASMIGLTNRGGSVPTAILKNSSSGAVSGDKDSRFEPGSYIEFYGKALSAFYTKKNVYTLRVAASAANLVKTETKPPKNSAAAPQFYLETRTVERNRAYSFAAPNGDPWYDTSILAFKSPVQQSFGFDLDGLVKGAAPASITVYAWGVTDWPQAPDHHLKVQVNNTNVADDFFDGLVTHTTGAEVASELLEQSGNSLKLVLPGDTGAQWDLINLDRFTITYPRSFTARDGKLTFNSAGEVFRVEGLPSASVVVYRLSDKGFARLGAVKVEGAPGAYTATFSGQATTATYFVSTVEALMSPALKLARPTVDITTQPADYLVISHPDFIAGLQPLAQARKAQGLKVRVVNVEDIYAQFNYGIIDAQAIRRYIAHARNVMKTKYVLLVGGDTYDYHNYTSQGAISFIPSLYAATGSIVSFAPVDPLYADVDNDAVPDLAIGRLPVRTSAELKSVIDKTLAYSTKRYSRTGVFAADQSDGNLSFTDHSEALIGQLSGDWQIQRAYIDYSGVNTARSDLLRAINEGVALTSFFGHSGPSYWTFKNLFSAADAASLTNANRPTVVMQWGCWNTYFVSPEYDTLGHKLMLSGNRGAAAVTGASTLTDANSEAALGRLLNSRLTKPGATIGMAILSAKKELAANSINMTEVILGWTLLGDPALVIQP